MRCARPRSISTSWSAVPIQFDAKGQNVNIKAAAVENLKRKPTVVMPLDSAAAPLVFPMPGWNDKRRT